MKMLLLTTVFALTSTSMAQTTNEYQCIAKDEKTPPLMTVTSITAQDKADAELKALKLMAKENVTKVTCSLAPRIGGLSDLANKKWEETSSPGYIVFQGHQILHVEKCDTGTITIKWNVEPLDDKSMKITFLENESEGSCSTVSMPFSTQPGSTLLLRVYIEEDKPSSLSIGEQLPGTDNYISSWFTEIK